MSAQHMTGLGKPEPLGKRALFLPPEPEVKSEIHTSTPVKQTRRRPAKKAESKVKRVRVTVDLTPKALTILQGVQQEYRLRTGKALPLWKATSQAIEGSDNRSGRNRGNQ